MLLVEELQLKHGQHPVSVHVHAAEPVLYATQTHTDIQGAEEREREERERERERERAREKENREELTIILQGLMGYGVIAHRDNYFSKIQLVGQ